MIKSSTLLMGKSWALIFCWKAWWFCFWALLCSQEHCLLTLLRGCAGHCRHENIFLECIISSSIGVLPFLPWGTRQIICNSAKAHLGIPSCLSADREKWYYSMSNFASEVLNFLFVNVSVFLISPVTLILMVNNTCLVFHPCFYPVFPLSVVFISPLW